ncbi:unnamed protein product, partial [Polarella glacialis]
AQALKATALMLQSAFRQIRANVANQKLRVPVLLAGLALLIGFLSLSAFWSSSGGEGEGEGEGEHDTPQPGEAAAAWPKAGSFVSFWLMAQALKATALVLFGAFRHFRANMANQKLRVSVLLSSLALLIGFLSLSAFWISSEESFVSVASKMRSTRTAVHIGKGYQERMSPRDHDKTFLVADATGASAG